MPDPHAAETPAPKADAQIVALRVIAGLLTVGLLYLMGTGLLPLVLALVLAIPLSPIADRLERHGLPRWLSALLCTSSVLLALLGTVALVGYQATSLASDADRYAERIGDLMGRGSRTQAGRWLRAVADLERADSARDDTHSDDASSRSPDQAKSKQSPGGDASAQYWVRLLRDNAQSIGRWAIRGLGGLLGLIGGVLVMLTLLLYMLQTRDEWVDRLQSAGRRLGLQTRRDDLTRVRDQIVKFFGTMFLVSAGYAAIVSLVLWAIGVPQPLLWGVLAALMEFIPYFGPLIAAVLPTLVALSLGSWWQPALVVAQYVGLHVFESTVVTPKLYGGAVNLNPVTVLIGVLFFGWLWGPIGLAVTMPMLILLRAVLTMTPETPALDALAGIDGAGPTTSSRAPAGRS